MQGNSIYHLKLSCTYLDSLHLNTEIFKPFKTLPTNPKKYLIHSRHNWHHFYLENPNGKTSFKWLLSFYFDNLWLRCNSWLLCILTSWPAPSPLWDQLQNDIGRDGVNGKAECHSPFIPHSLIFSPIFIFIFHLICFSLFPFLVYIYFLYCCIVSSCFLPSLIVGLCLCVLSLTTIHVVWIHFGSLFPKMIIMKAQEM